MKLFMKKETMMTQRENVSRSGWILSFGDIMTLLITFFIMMIARQSGEISRLHHWTYDRLEETRRQISGMLRDKDLSAFSVEHYSRGVRVTISGASLFNPGEAEPLPEFREQLSALAESVKNLEILSPDNPEHREILRELRNNNLVWHVELRVEGHTDDMPPGPNIRFRDNWELSAARAQRVMQILQQETGIPEHRFAVAGHGEYKPVTDNATEQGRNRNRRVEIYIDASIQKIQ